MTIDDKMDGNSRRTFLRNLGATLGYSAIGGAVLFNLQCGREREYMPREEFRRYVSEQGLFNSTYSVLREGLGEIQTMSDEELKSEDAFKFAQNLLQYTQEIQGLETTEKTLFNNTLVFYLSQNGKIRVGQDNLKYHDVNNLSFREKLEFSNLFKRTVENYASTLMSR